MKKLMFWLRGPFNYPQPPIMLYPSQSPYTTSPSLFLSFNSYFPSFKLSFPPIKGSLTWSPHLCCAVLFPLLPTHTTFSPISHHRPNHFYTHSFTLFIILGSMLRFASSFVTLSLSLSQTLPFIAFQVLQGYFSQPRPYIIG